MVLPVVQYPDAGPHLFRTIITAQYRMRHEVSFYRFRANITREGTIIVPGDVVARFRTGQAILVSVAPAVRLGSGGEIDDEEVAAIATLQAVPADVIHRCLNAQGALAGRVRFTGRKPQRQPGKR